jgi:predicted PurR-regulated permease PerM
MDILIALLIVFLVWYFTQNLIAVLVIAVAVAIVVWALRNGGSRTL